MSNVREITSPEKCNTHLNITEKRKEKIKKNLQGTGKQVQNTKNV